MADFVEQVTAKCSRPDLRERGTGTRPLPQPQEMLHAFEQGKGPWAHPAAEMDLQHATLLTCRQLLERIGWLPGDRCAWHRPAGQPCRHRPLISWRLNCPVCGLDCTQGTCDHQESFVADVPVDAVVTAALDLF